MLYIEVEDCMNIFLLELDWKVTKAEEYSSLFVVYFDGQILPGKKMAQKLSIYRKINKMRKEEVEEENLLNKFVYRSKKNVGIKWNINIIQFNFS